MSVNWPRSSKPSAQKTIKALIASRAEVATGTLADADVPFDQLIPEP